MTINNDTRPLQKNKRVLTAGFGLMFLLLASTALVIMPASTSVSAVSSSTDKFNKAGNLLITDQFNNRVIEVNPSDKHIVWSFGSNDPDLCNPGPKSIIGVNDAHRLADGLTIMAGTGIPAGASKLMPNGCADNRVIVVDQSGKIVWQYGQAGVNGTGKDELNVPAFAIQLPNHNFMIVDQGNNRILEVSKDKHVVWSYGPASGPGALNSPNSAELLQNGHILISDENNNRAIEINRSGHIVWEFSKGLNTVAFASRLPNGDTLIADAGHSRILEIDSHKKTVFEYFTNTSPRSISSPAPTNAVRTADGDTSIADQFNDRVIIIDANKHIEFQYGKTNAPGTGPDELHAPYTSYVIGDNTGQTPPPSHF